VRTPGVRRRILGAFSTCDDFSVRTCRPGRRPEREGSLWGNHRDTHAGRSVRTELSRAARTPAGSWEHGAGTASASRRPPCRRGGQVENRVRTASTLNCEPCSTARCWAITHTDNGVRVRPDAPPAPRRREHPGVRVRTRAQQPLVLRLRNLPPRVAEHDRSVRVPLWGVVRHHSGGLEDKGGQSRRADRESRAVGPERHVRVRLFDSQNVTSLRDRLAVALCGRHRQRGGGVHGGAPQLWS